MTRDQWACDGECGRPAIVEGHKVLSALSNFGRKGEWWSAQHFVLGGRRYAKTAESAKNAGWEDLERFIRAAEAFAAEGEKVYADKNRSFRP